MSLGDFFPKKLKQEFAQRNIDIGSALYNKLKNIKAGKIKYSIVIAFNDTKTYVAYVLVNTIINSNVHNSKSKTAHLQIPISATDFSFLDHDSFIDASDLKEEKFQTIANYIQKNPEAVVGNVSKEIIRKIHFNISGSKKVSKVIKEKYGFI